MKRSRILLPKTAEQAGYKPVLQPKINKAYALQHQPHTRRFILKSWDNSGTCTMETTVGKTFYSTINDLRVPPVTP